MIFSCRRRQRESCSKSDFNESRKYQIKKSNRKGETEAEADKNIVRFFLSLPDFHWLYIIDMRTNSALRISVFGTYNLFIFGEQKKTKVAEK